MFTLFIECASPPGPQAPSTVPQEDLARIRQIASEVPGATGSSVYYRGEERYPWDMAEGALPALWVTVRFATLEALEAAVSSRGPLAALGQVPFIAALPAGLVNQQAMLSRDMPLPESSGGAARPAERCAYVIAYEGEPQDESEWLHYYLDRHAPIVARLPRLLRLEVCTRIDWRSGLPWPRARTFLKSTVNFASADELNAAFSTPVRGEIRADAGRMPAFTGEKPHLVMQIAEAASGSRR